MNTKTGETVAGEIVEIIEDAAREAAAEAVENTPPQVTVIEPEKPDQPVAEIAAAAQAVQATSEAAAALANANAAERVATFEGKLLACLSEMEALKSSIAPLQSMQAQLTDLETNFAALILTLKSDANLTSEETLPPTSEVLPPLEPQPVPSADALPTPKKPRVRALGARKRR